MKGIVWDIEMAKKSKFKAGDIVTTTNDEKWPLTLEILDVGPYRYTVQVIKVSGNPYETYLSTTTSFEMSEIDIDWELDIAYMAVKQFDNDLKEILK
jgi:hypothetical protein